MIELIIPGVPVQQGSVSAFVNRKTGRAQVTHQNPAPLSRYRGDIRDAAARAGITRPTDQPVWISLDFYFPRPKSHFGSGRNAGTVKDSAPTHLTTRPDADKLIRSVLDSLTGIAFNDDSQVVEIQATKYYVDDGCSPETRIQLGRLPDGKPVRREESHDRAH